MREPTEMELRVARAILLAPLSDDLKSQALADDTLDRMTEDQVGTMLKIARAAIRAMHEPTIEMLDDGLMASIEAECMSDDGVTVGASEGDDPFEIAWKAMIDCASPGDK